MQAVKHIIPQFKITKGTHCYYACIYNMLKHNNIHLTEAEVFVLSGGFMMRYYDKTKKLDTTVHDKVSMDFAKRFSAGIHFIQDDIRDRAIEEIYESISKNNLVLLAVRNKYLDYNQVYQESEDYLHYIIMYGYDMEAGLAYIADTFMLDHAGEAQTYIGPAALHNIEMGLGAYACFHTENKNIISDDEVFSLFVASFKDFLTIQFYPSDKDIILGNQAIYKYIENIFCDNKLTGESFEKACINAIYNLKFGVLFHMLEYLMQIITKYHFRWREYKSLLHELIAIKAKWHKYFIYLLKVAYSGKEERAKEAVMEGLDIFDKQKVLFNTILHECSEHAH